MKSSQLYIALSVIAILSVVTGCNKDVNTLSEGLIPLQPANIDANAGTWKLILLTTPGQIVVAAPAAVTSTAYVAELAAIKDAQSKLNDNQKKTILLGRWGHPALEPDLT